MLFNKAVEFGVWDKVNPAKGIKKFRETSRDRFLQPHELPNFFKALAEETNEPIRDYVLLSLLTGARRGNVLSMCWEDIRFETSEWYIPETKNGLPHTVTLTQEAVAILVQRKKQQIEKTPFVFPSTGAKGHLTEPKKGWKRLLEHANIKNLRIHDLRRTLGSWQAREGASLTIIGKSLNHKSPLSTSIYARLDLDPVRFSIEKAVDAMFKAGNVQSIKKIVATT
jgi:integrase